MKRTDRGTARLRIAAAAVLTILLGGILMSGCGGKRYAVDYCGEKDAYKGAEDTYRAGAQVTLYYDLIATDTDYSFYLDGERLLQDYDDSCGFIIRFTMPEHDVKLECVTRNTMEYVPETQEAPGE